VPLLRDGSGCVCLFPDGGGVEQATCPFPKDGFHACRLHAIAVAANGCQHLRRRLESYEQPELAARAGRVHSNRRAYWESNR